MVAQASRPSGTRHHSGPLAPHRNDRGLGDYKRVGKGIGELRIDHGPGYRLYAYRDGPLVLLLLFGSAKGDQQAAIAQAAAYLKDWKERNA